MTDSPTKTAERIVAEAFTKAREPEYHISEAEDFSDARIAVDALVEAGLLVLGAPSEEQIEMAWGVLNAYGLAAHIRTSGKREREVVGEMLTAAGVGSPVPVQVDETKAQALEVAAAQIPFPADPYGGFDHESLRGAYTQMTNWLRGRAEMLRGGAQ